MPFLRLFLPPAAVLAAMMWTLGAAHAAETGRIDGRILLSPAHPVSRAGKPNERGVPGRVRITDHNGETVAELASDSKGRFLIALTPGKYTLHLESGPRPGRAADQHVTVVAGKVAKAVIKYDAGIR